MKMIARIECKPSVSDESILCVDDDPNILDAFQRQFRKRFSIQTAVGPQQGLEMLTEKGPFAVVVSDLTMPGMDGVQFLSAVRAQSPDSVRIMLTGHADLTTAIAAVNQGNIFRLLIKPCPPMVLSQGIEAGIEQHRLLMAERQLTRETLLGCVEVLVEVLSILEPRAFSRVTRLRRYVRHVAEDLKIPDPWTFEAAAMLSQIGWITLPPEIAAKVSAGEPLSPEESRRFAEHPSAAARLLEKVPRLEKVAKIIEGQLSPFENFPGATGADWDDPAVLGSQILRAAAQFDDLRERGASSKQALQEMSGQPGTYDDNVLAAIECIEKRESEAEIRLVGYDELIPNMILEEEIDTPDGLCLLGKGREITPTALLRLSGFRRVLRPRGKFRVRMPAQPAAVPAPDA